MTGVLRSGVPSFAVLQSPHLDIADPGTPPPPADTTAPTLSIPTAVQTGSSTANVGVTTNEGNGTLYYVVTTSATAPTALQVEAGQNNLGTAAAASGSQAVTTAGIIAFAVTGLTAATVYYVFFMHKDAAGNRSAVTTGTSFTTTLPATITTPVITKTSAAGAAPFTFDLSLNLTNAPPDSTIHVQWIEGTTSPTKNTTSGDPNLGAYIAGGTIHDIYHFFDESEAASFEDGTGSIDIASDGFASWSGQGAIHLRIERDDGVVSAWSNDLSDTITSSVAKWDSFTSSNHDASTTFSNGDLTVQGVIDSGFKRLNRATIATSQTKGQFEVKVQTGTAGHNGGLYFGLDDGTVDYSTPPSFSPGGVDNKGFTINVGIGTTVCDTYTNSQAVHDTTALSTACASNDVFTVEWDRSGSAGSHILKVYRNGTQIRNHTGLTLTTFTHAFAGGTSNDLLTGNFGASTFTHALNSGFNIYG